MHSPREQLQRALAHVYWLGGSPCAGKSSIADSLAQAYGLRIYRCDDAFFVHEKIVTPELQPVFYRLVHLSSEDLWIRRSIEQQFTDEVAFYYEEFALILADLLALPEAPPILAEGAALLPACVSPLLLDPRRAMWVVPTREFQLHHYSHRQWSREVVSDCSDPDQAFRNWMERDIRFAMFVSQEATARRLPVLIVDGQRSLTENTETVERHFQLSH
jgi:2-phosphoglycerate kinase